MAKEPDTSALQLSKVDCGDFMAFQEILVKSRKIDDNIVQAINSSILTESLVKKGAPKPDQQCASLWSQLQNTYDQRESSLKHCICQISKSVKALKELRETQDTMEVHKQLKKEQGKLRLLQNELNVEEIVRDRSVKIFQERCRNYFTIPKSS